MIPGGQFLKCDTFLLNAINKSVAEYNIFNIFSINNHSIIFVYCIKTSDKIGLVWISNRIIVDKLSILSMLLIF